MITSANFLRMEGGINDPWSLSPKQWADAAKAITETLKMRVKLYG